MGGNEGVFMSALFNKSFTQYLSIWSTVGTFHNLSSDAALLFLTEKKFLYFILQAKCLQMHCKCWIRLLMLGGKKKHVKCCIFLVLPSAHFMCDWTSHLFKSLQNLWAELFSFLNYCFLVQCVLQKLWKTLKWVPDEEPFLIMLVWTIIDQLEFPVF